MVTAWRRLLAAAVIPLVLAGCTSGARPPGAGTGPADRPAGSASGRYASRGHPTMPTPPGWMARA